MKQRWPAPADEGIAAPIDARSVHYVVVGATWLPFTNAPEARLLMGVEPTDPNWVDTHADGIVATLLPGLRHQFPDPRTGSRHSCTDSYSSTCQLISRSSSWARP